MDELMQTMTFEPGVHFFHALVPARVFFETPEGGGGEGGGGEGGGEAATAVIDPAAGGEAGAGAEAVEYLTPDDIAELVRENAGSAFAEMLAQAEQRDAAAAAQREAQQRAQAANQAPQWDPFDPASVDRYVEWRAAQMIRPLMERVAPAIEFAENGSVEAGKTQANSLLDSYHEELGDFDHDPAILKAAAYMRQGLQPEQALAQAAQEQADWEAKIEARAFEKFKTAGQNLADAGVEPGAGGAAAEAPQPLSGAGQRRDYKVEARATLARMGVNGGVGTPTG